jgi:hypothetical protein
MRFQAGKGQRRRTTQIVTDAFRRRTPVTGSRIYLPLLRDPRICAHIGCSGFGAWTGLLRIDAFFQPKASSVADDAGTLAAGFALGWTEKEHFGLSVFSSKAFAFFGTRA